HGRDVLGVTYSPDGDLLASGGFDNIARIWDVASGQCRAVISESQNIVSGIAWNVISEVRCLVTGCEDGSVQNWQLLGEADQFQVRLCWSGTNGALRVTGANMQDARGLTQLDKQLLKQRGAVGEPENLLREASKKMSAMASVVSKLKRLSDKAVGDSSSDANTLCNQLEQQIDKPDAKQLQHQAEQPNQDAERLEQHLDQLGKHAEQPEQPIPEDQQDDS
ncbi:U3 snoRNP protein, partial [Mortierella sp. GBA43]